MVLFTASWGWTIRVKCDILWKVMTCSGQKPTIILWWLIPYLWFPPALSEGIAWWGLECKWFKSSLNTTTKLLSETPPLRLFTSGLFHCDPSDVTVHYRVAGKHGIRTTSYNFRLCRSWGIKTLWILKSSLTRTFSSSLDNLHLTSCHSDQWP